MMKADFVLLGPQNSVTQALSKHMSWILIQTFVLIKRKVNIFTVLVKIGEGSGAVVNVYDSNYRQR
jgi:hypothetical protein